MRSACPTDDELLVFAQGQLGDARSAGITEHASWCASCAAALAEAARGLAGSAVGASGSLDGAPPGAAAATLQPGARLGRYSILELLGKGAMGVVYAAYDPQLDRRVALKLLRPDPRVQAGRPELRQRLLREAQAMARLHHPNVLAIHDAVELEGGIFLAMELVAGGTLRSWLARAERSPAEVLEVFRQAGEGLAAAHRAGIVHRDFKADNVLIDEAGRVFVTDFGVARLDHELPSDALADEQSALSLTQSGAMVGTPAYMSPEQLRGQPADARSDVFGFCASLYEALFRARPFAGGNLAELRKAVAEGHPAEPPAGREVPAPVVRAVLRGLRPEPADRFQSMDELLAALSLRPPERARFIALAALVALAVGGAVFVGKKLEDRRLDSCRRGDGRIERVFDDARQAAVREAFDKSGAPSAKAVFASAREGLVAVVKAIADGRAEACAAHQRGEASADLLDRRMQCLDDRLQDAAALIDAFTRADATTVEKATGAAQQLGDPAACADRWRLLDGAPPPHDPRERARIAQAREQVAQLAALHQSGRYREGLERSPAVVLAAKKTAHAPLLAEALLWRGRLLFDGNEQTEAPAALIAATAAATRARRDDLAAQAESELVHALGWAQKLDEALRWAEHARAVIARGGDDPPRLAQLLLARFYAYAKVFKSTEALADAQEALALLERAGSPPARLLPAVSAVASALTNIGRYQDAMPVDVRAVALAGKTYGPLHPATLSALAHQGTNLTQAGDRRAALPILRQIREGRIALLGKDHLDVARTNGAIGSALEGLGDAEGSASAYAEATAIVERRLGKDHPELIGNLALSALPLARLGRFAEAKANLDRSEALAKKHQGDKSGMLGFIIEARGTVLEIEGRSADAARAYQQAIARIEAAAPGHPDIANCKAGIARHLRRSGRAKEAAEAHAALLAAAEKQLGAEAPGLVDPLFDLGEDLLALGRDAAARPLFERALKLADPERGDPLSVAEVRFAAARAFWPVLAERSRALTLARQAREALAASRVSRPTLRDEIERWLLARERPRR